MKKFYVILSLVIIVAIPLVLFTVSSVLSPKKSPSTIALTPTPTGALSVIKTVPSLNQKNVPVSQPISIEFNKTLTLADVTIISSPPTQYNMSINGSALTMSPFSFLSSSTSYVITINSSDHKKLIYTLVFSTEGPIPTTIDTRPSGEPQKTDDLLKKDRPDAFLSNKMPYSTTDFKAVYAFKSAPTGHFAFTVTLLGTNKDASKLSFINWVKSFGITDAQINQLDITYR